MALASYLVFFFLISHQLLLSLSEQDNYSNLRCPPFSCGHVGSIGFPFSNRTHPECGLLIIDNCTQPGNHTIQLAKNKLFFYIEEIAQDNTLELHDQPLSDIPDNSTCKSFRNLAFPRFSFISFNITYKQPPYKCPHTHYTIPINYRLLCNYSTYYVIVHKFDDSNRHNNTLPTHCSAIWPRVTKTQKHVFFHDIFTGWFFLQINVRRECHECNQRGGQCQSDGKDNFYCSYATTGNAKGHPIINAVAVTASGIVVLMILALCFRKRLSIINSIAFWEKKCKYDQNIQAFLRNYGSPTPKRYSYLDIKRMTNSFKHKLGQGGYGGVYKGKLLDGCEVAVKVLNGSKGNGEDFINEVASISRTSHVNIVGLLGYCFERQRRALIYEFVPNGSLEKFIYERYSTDKQLNWEKLHQIALGIAQGLEYLHLGCSTRILHFDIKPHNILLDEDFCPKISDFGLAKICPRKESIISMTGARGTVGYIAPEVFCRSFGEVSHKSDVYSYGMMVLEMVGGRKNIDVRASHISEIYFPHWIYNRLEVDEELGLNGIESEKDNEYARKMTIVSLWCIQTNPSSRPAICRVVEMLEGSLHCLQIPPKPFLSSPKSEAVESTTSLMC